MKRFTIFLVIFSLLIPAVSLGKIPTPPKKKPPKTTTSGGSSTGTSGGRTGGRTGGSSGGRTGGTSGGRTGGRTSGTSGGRTGGRTSGTTGGRTSSTPAATLRWDSSTNTLTYGNHTYRMVNIPGGTFTMGANPGDSEAYDWEKPAHSVTLSSFYIGSTEVPQWLWKAVMGNNPSNWKGDLLPVEMVSWEDCRNFIDKLNSLTGAWFRLPTQAQWEYAARGGNYNNLYSGSYDIDEVAWYDGNSGGHTHEVATKRPNGYGLYDMTGNVWEWCFDWYASYQSGSQTNPTGPASGSYRVNRGGSWNFTARYCRVSNRFNDSPGNTYDFLGFRLAL